MWLIFRMETATTRNLVTMLPILRWKCWTTSMNISMTATSTPSTSTTFVTTTTATLGTTTTTKVASSVFPWEWTMSLYPRAPPTVPNTRWFPGECLVSQPSLQDTDSAANHAGTHTSFTNPTSTSFILPPYLLWVNLILDLFLLYDLFITSFVDWLR